MFASDFLFGQLIEDGSTKTTDAQGFVGKRFDAETGLLDFGARVYSPLLGRFLSIDPAEVQGDNPFSFNRYIYANDNPYKYKDPDGRNPVLIGLKVLDWTASAASAYGAYQTGGGSAAAKDFAISAASSKVPGGAFTKKAGDFFRAEKTAAKSAKQAANLSEHLTQSQKYGKAGVKELGNGKFRYYGELDLAKKRGEMAGRRVVREWDPSTGSKRTWHETLDHSGNIRQVRPEFNNGAKQHYTFDKSGSYTGRWP